MKLERIKKEINKYDYVSFDVFDTLVNRNVKSPDDVFDLVEFEYNKNKVENKIKNFKEKRILAEKKVMEETKKESVTFDEIYKKIDYNKEIQYELKKIELNIEFSIIQKNNFMYQVYEFCKESGKKIIAISDMYLEGNTLEKLLNKNNIEVEKCFSSCNYGVTKSSGKLYKKVLEELNIKPNQIIHFGDSLKSDYIKAIQNGINAIRIKPKKYFRYKKRVINNKYDNVRYNGTKIFINNNIIDNNDNYYYNIGFSKFGILIYGFCRWLYNEIEEKNIKKIYFLSRDGFILKKAYDILYPDEYINPKYLYISRRAIRVPTLFLNSKFENLSENINMSNNFNLTTFIKRLGLKREDVEEFIKPEIDKEFSKKEFFKDKKVKEFYEQIKDTVIQNSKKEYEIFKKYLIQEKMYGNIAIVDIGWEGTIQKKLNEFIGENDKIFGYYFGIYNSIKENVQGYLFNSRDGLEEKNIISASFGLFETLFLANEGSVRKYKTNKDRVEPVLEKYEFLDENGIELKEIQYVKEIQKGALDFVAKYKDQIYINKYIENSKIYFEELVELLVNPTNKDIKKMKNILFNDTFNVKLVESEKIYKYINLRLFKKDFFNSVWKIGFLKNVLKIKLPYFYFYKKIRMFYKGKEDGKN